MVASCFDFCDAANDISIQCIATIHYGNSWIGVTCKRFLYRAQDRSEEHNASE